jgi:hypothetical protein
LRIRGRHGSWSDRSGADRGGLHVPGRDVLDATVDWAEGRITGRELLVSAGLAVGLSLVGGGAAKLGANALRRLARTGLAAGAGGRLPQDMNLVKV